jgi:hypothetical protein
LRTSKGDLRVQFHRQKSRRARRRRHGAQIAAHCINARVPVVLFDLPAKEGPKNGIVLRAIENLKKLSLHRWATRMTRR